MEVANEVGVGGVGGILVLELVKKVESCLSLPYSMVVGGEFEDDVG